MRSASARQSPLEPNTPASINSRVPKVSATLETKAADDRSLIQRNGGGGFGWGSMRLFGRYASPPSVLHASRHAYPLLNPPVVPNAHIEQRPKVRAPVLTFAPMLVRQLLDEIDNQRNFGCACASSL